MRILWITNIPIGKAGEFFFGKPSSGLWMDAALEDFSGDTANELFIATTGNVTETQIQKDDSVTYYLLPDKLGYEYKSGKPSNLTAISKMLDEIQPQIIQIWGTENQVAEDLITCNNNQFPVVVYIQGVIASLERYFKAGISTKEILLNYTPMDLLRKTGIFQQMKRYRKQADREAKIVLAIQNIIGENLWSKAYYKSISQDVRFYPCPLHLNRCFADVQWDAANIESHSIMCNSSNYSIKGLHILLQAMSIVRKTYPDVKLYLPGNNPAQYKSFKASFTQSGYIKYLKKLIKKRGLDSSVEFLSFLTPEQMAQKMTQSHVFVVPSAIENHSSSLKEAMLVGVPSVGTYVGGVSEYVRHGENGFLYRFEEPEVLADLICQIFASDSLAKKLSENARADMMALHIDCDLHKRFVEIYESIIEEEQK